MSTPVISVQGLEKSYGTFQAVRGIDFEVHPGEVFGLLGPNGAGKTKPAAPHGGRREGSGKIRSKVSSEDRSVDNSMYL